MEAQTISARQIIHNHTDGRLSARPEYYSGRGVNRGDLGPNHLVMVYNGVLKELGADAAKAMLELLENLKDMSATGFLNALYRLEGNDWKFDKRMIRDADGVAFNDDVGAMFTVLAAFGRKSTPELDSYEGDSIKFDFFRQVGHTYKSKPTRRITSYGYGNMDLLGEMPIEEAVDKGYLVRPKLAEIKIKRPRKKLPSKDKIPKGHKTVYHVNIFGTANYAGPFRSRRRAGRYIKSDSTITNLEPKIVSHPVGWKWKPKNSFASRNSLSKRLY